MQSNAGPQSSPDCSSSHDDQPPFSFWTERDIEQPQFQSKMIPVPQFGILVSMRRVSMLVSV